MQTFVNTDYFVRFMPKTSAFFNFRAAAWIKTFSVTAKRTAKLPIRILIAMVIIILQVCMSLVQRRIEIVSELGADTMDIL